MKQLLYMRLLHVKRQALSTVFWIMLPLLGTIFFMQLLNVVKDDTSIPVGIVLEEESPHALELVDKFQEESFFTIYMLKEKEALHQLEKHELDSVFVIREGYESKIERGNRTKLLYGYESDMSFAYASAQETIQSLVQQQAGRYKAADEVARLHLYFDASLEESEAELIERSKEIEEERTLLYTSMTYAGENDEEKGQNIISPILIWAFISFLTSFFLFDWVIKEKNAQAALRFLFTKKSMTTYLVEHFVLYTCILFLIDLGIFYLLDLLYGNILTISFMASLLVCRFLWNSGAFLLSLWIKQLFSFYLIGLSLFFITLVSYVLGVTANGEVFQWLHPMEAFMQGKYVNVWLLFNIILLVGFIVRKGDSYVTHK